MQHAAIMTGGFPLTSSGPDTGSIGECRGRDSGKVLVPLIRLLYTSRESTPFSDAALRELIDDSNRRNAERGITGVLLYASGRFMQLMEGPAQEVRDLARRIAKDPRHRDVVFLIDQPASHRMFYGWGMGLVHTNPDGAAADDAPGIVPMLLEVEGHDIVLNLLQNFHRKYIADAV